MNRLVDLWHTIDSRLAELIDTIAARLDRWAEDHDPDNQRVDAMLAELVDLMAQRTGTDDAALDARILALVDTLAAHVHPDHPHNQPPSRTDSHHPNDEPPRRDDIDYTMPARPVVDLDPRPPLATLDPYTGPPLPDDDTNEQRHCQPGLYL